MKQINKYRCKKCGFTAEFYEEKTNEDLMISHYCPFCTDYTDEYYELFNDEMGKVKKEA